MSVYSVAMEMVQRERRTKERIDGMDTPDLVEEIHTLEDKIGELERALKGVVEKLDNSEAGEFAQDEIRDARRALEC